MELSVDNERLTMDRPAALGICWKSQVVSSVGQLVFARSKERAWDLWNAVRIHPAGTCRHLEDFPDLIRLSGLV